jgi:hypothetical protein
MVNLGSLGLAAIIQMTVERDLAVVLRKKPADFELSRRNLLQRAFVMQTTQDRPRCHTLTLREAVP